MRSALAGVKGGMLVGKSGTFRGYFKHAYTGVLSRGVPARGRGRNQRAAVVGFGEECGFFHHRCELVVPAPAGDRECVVTWLLEF